MSVCKLIEFFSTFTKLPIYAEDVRDQIVDLGIQDEIIFVKMDVDPRDLLGMYVRFRRRSTIYDHNPKKCSIILFNGNVDPETQNLICIKELMHVFDGKIEAETDTREDFSVLMEDLFAKAAPLGFSPGGIMDNMALFIAVAVMFPHEIRDNFIAAHNSERMSVRQIALETGLPEAFVPRLLSKEWEKIRAFLMRF